MSRARTQELLDENARLLAEIADLRARIAGVVEVLEGPIEPLWPASEFQPGLAEEEPKNP